MATATAPRTPAPALMWWAAPVVVLTVGDAGACEAVRGLVVAGTDDEAAGAAEADDAMLLMTCAVSNAAETETHRRGRSTVRDDRAGRGGRDGTAGRGS